MGKKNKDSDSDKKKKKKKDKKKDKKKKEKKDKKKKAKSSSSSSSSAGEAAVGLPVEPNAAAAAPELNVVNMDALPALEEGILRFEFSSQERGVFRCVMTTATAAATEKETGTRYSSHCNSHSK